MNKSILLLLAFLACCVVLEGFVSAVDVPTLAPYSRVYFGGNMTTLNNTLVNNVGYYDMITGKINQLGEGTDGEVKVVKVDMFGNVYIGGSFSRVGSLNTGPVAMWNVYTSSWTSTGLNSSLFSAGSIVSTLDVSCDSMSSASSLNGLFSCDIYVGGRFEASLESVVAKNFMFFDHTTSSWKVSLTTSIDSVSVILAVVVDTKKVVLVGGSFYGNQYSLGVYLTYSKQWEYPAGVVNITDITYNLDFRADYVIVAAEQFPTPSVGYYCSGFCAMNLLTYTWENAFNTGVSHASDTSITKVRFVRGFYPTSPNNNSLVIGGFNVRNSAPIALANFYGVSNLDSSESSPQNAILGMDLFGSNSDRNGFVVVGGVNFFKFYDNQNSGWLNVVTDVGFKINSLVVDSVFIPSPVLSWSVNYYENLSFKVKSNINFVDSGNVCQLGIINGKHSTFQSLTQSSTYTMYSIPCSSESIFTAPYYGYPYTKFLLSYENTKYTNISTSLFRQQREYYEYFPTFYASVGNMTQTSVVYTDNTLSFFSNITSNIPTLECRADVIIDGTTTTIYRSNCTTFIKFSVPLLPQFFINKEASIVITLSNAEYYFEESESFEFELSPCNLNCQNGGLCKKQADGYAYCDCTGNYVGDLCQYCKQGYVMQNGSCIANQSYNFCYGTNNSGLVCNGHGSCLESGHCKCYPGYSGNDCSIPICFSLDANEFGVCYGNGKCVAPDTCSCNSLFSGMECETPTCNGKTELEGACSFQGTCNAFTHTCVCKGNFIGSSCSSCKDGFTGEKCDVPVCNGIKATDRFVCNGKGSCLSFNNSAPICVCTGEYYGSNCGNFKCNGIERTSSSACSSNGVCTGADVCSCSGNFDPASFCSKCLPSFNGSTCSIPICNSETTCSGKGQCNDMLQCVCNGNFEGTFCEKCKDGWVGNNCNYACSAATTCSGRGTCSQIGECLCSENTNGKNCEKCNEGWFGDRCDFNIAMDSFEFNENGDSIVAIVKSSIKRRISCSSLIVNTEVLGINPSCILDGDKSQLVVQLGPLATIVIGGQLDVRAFFESSSITAAAVSGTNYRTVNPVAHLTSDTSSIACGSIILDASASSSLDRRQLTFTYSATLAPTNQDINTLNSLINNTSTSLLRFPVNQLSIGTYSVQVAVKSSFSGRVSSATFTFNVAESSPPILTIRNGLSSSITIGNSFAIVPIVSFPSCYRGNPSASRLKFTYTQTSGPNVLIKQRNELLVFSSDFTHITEEGDYSFTLKAQEDGYPEALVSFRVTAVALPLRVSFNIRDMSQSREDNVKFRITKHDPSNPNSSEGEVKLLCTDLETMLSCSGFDNGLNIDQSTLLFDRQFNPGTYLFTAVFTKSSRSSATSVRVTVTSQSKTTFLRIYIDGPLGFDLSAADPSNDLILQAQSLDVLSSQRTFTWSSTDLILDSIDTSRKFFSIPKSLLVPGASYSVSVTVRDVFKVGEASISFIVNSAPSLGVLDVSPSSGVALIDEFSVSCGNGWSDSHLPLSFQFMFRQKGQQAWKVLKERSETRSFRTVMPTGQLEIKAMVYDSKGAFTETISNIEVVSPIDVSSAIQSLGLISTSTMTPSLTSSALSVINSFNQSSTEERQQLIEAGSRIVQAFFNQKESVENVTPQTETSTSSTFSVISSVSTSIENLLTDVVGLTITEFKSTVDGAFSNLFLPNNDITSSLNSATAIQNYVSGNLAVRSLMSNLFTKDQVKTIDQIKETLIYTQLKNAVPDMPAVRAFGSNYHIYARLLSVSSLSNLNESVDTISSFKLSQSFNELEQVSNLDNIKLVMKVQKQDMAVSKLFIFRIESQNVDLLVKSSDNTTYIAELTIEKNPTTRSIKETQDVCAMLENGQLVVSNSCEIISSTGGAFTIKVSSSGEYTIISQEVVTPPPPPVPEISIPITNSSSNNIITTNKSENLALIALITLIIPIIAIIVIVVIVIVCCVRRKKNKKEAEQQELSFMELREI